MNTIASTLTEAMRLPDGSDRRDGNPNAIYTVLNGGDDQHPVPIAMTIGMLDAWWESLSATEKADVCERWHEPYSEVEQAEAIINSFRNPMERIVAAGELMVKRNQLRMDASFQPHPRCQQIERGHL